MGRWWRGRGAPVSGEELVSGGGSGRGRAEEGVPRRPTEERRRAQARTGASGRLKRTKGEEGGGLGPVARGIDGRPRSAAQAAAWPGSLGATAASRRVVELLSFAACSSSERNAVGSTGRGRGRSAAGVRAGCSWPGSERQGSGAARHAWGARVPALRAEQRGEGQQGRERKEREREWREKTKVNRLT